MTLQAPIQPKNRRADDLATRIVARASRLGHQIVEMDGFLSDLRDRSKEQEQSLHALDASARQVRDANRAVGSAIESLVAEADGAREMIKATIADLRHNADRTETLATWVNELEARMNRLSDIVDIVRTNTSSISHISKEINILAINARIEAVRAGDAGRGFSVVAEAINSLARQTTETAAQITENIGDLGGTITQVTDETIMHSAHAGEILMRQNEINSGLAQIRDCFDSTHQNAANIARDSDVSRAAMEHFMPAYQQMSIANRATFTLIDDATRRTTGMVTAGEEILQSAIIAGGQSTDSKMIEFVKDDAHELAGRLERALEQGQISRKDLFSEVYQPIPGTTPQQFLAPFTDLTDRLFPDILEAALARDPTVVFCAAVDRNGYLPTHNRKFSAPQGADPVENEAKSRNRRMFNDRVGLKAGRNQRQFLVQIYRRHMGGGEYAMMKDISAPIIVNGQHWGGLRLAYRA